MTHETAKEWAARPGAVVRHWISLCERWSRIKITPRWHPELAYAIFDGHRSVLVSIGPHASKPDVGSQMLEALGAPKDASITIVRDGEVVGKPHPLQADIVKWAGDPERWGWQVLNTRDEWCGRDRPPSATENPARFRLIDRHAPKGPLTEAPEVGAEYWLVSFVSDDYCRRRTWSGSPEVRLLLTRRLCFPVNAREEAAALGRRMAEVAMGEKGR